MLAAVWGWPDVAGLAILCFLIAFIFWCFTRD